MQSRYYNPEIGRFISKDEPVFHEGETGVKANLYAYCNNNPIMLTDPSGHWGNGWWNSVGFVGTTLDVIITAVSGGIAIAGINSIKKYLKQNAGKLVKNIAPKLTKMIGSTVSSALFSIFDIALTLFATSIGELIAKAIDWCDPWWGKTRNNGYVFG